MGTQYALHVPPLNKDWLQTSCIEVEESVSVSLTRLTALQQKPDNAAIHGSHPKWVMAYCVMERAYGQNRKSDKDVYLIALEITLRKCYL